ncbi:hypothetical protein H0H93_005845 [Arthromyces matolae]|nr:hypothetical protein H0H93_005845 [Arthromyces matolae]
MPTTMRRTISTRTRSKNVTEETVNKLADQLTSNLTISDTKGKQKATLSSEQIRLDSMRAVNSASQQLSAVIESGWKKSPGKPSTQPAVKAATSAAKHLHILRKDELKDINVERASMSVLAKLVSLEMYDEALSALDALHYQLYEFLGLNRPQFLPRNHLVSIPFPLSETLDITLLTLILTYLLHSLTILSNLPPSSSRIEKETATTLDSLSHALDCGSVSFLLWIPRCSTIPRKQLDSLLTRVYTTLTRACNNGKASSRSLLHLRMYAAKCLAYTGVGTVEPKTFWDQVVRFNVAFVKSHEVQEEETIHVVLPLFSDLIRILEETNSASEFLSGKGFVGFCEYWLAFAKRSTSDPVDEYARLRTKLDRALERLRRAALAVLDSLSPSDDASSLVLLLESIVDILQLQSVSEADKVTRALDTLFVLARIRLIPSNTRTYIPAHDYLSQATALVNSRSAIPSFDGPNYLRCISGAFYSLAGTLYQAQRFGSSVGFLKDACFLGAQALKTRRTADVAEDMQAKTADGWRQLEEQLYRRWELLGVCYLKNGDRKQALEAFRSSIETFPYAACDFSGRTAQITFSDVFTISNGTKQLASIIDRITTLGACELLLEPTAVSLVSLELGDAEVVGALLEQQVRSLEAIRYKDNVSKTISHLLHDTLRIYGSSMPVRRARVLVKRLEHMYYSGSETTCADSNSDETGTEIETLLQNGGLGKDEALAAYIPQYRAVSHLWRALHVHRRIDTKQSELVAYHSEEACRLLKPMPSGTCEHGSAKKVPQQERTVPRSAAAPKKPRSARKVPVGRGGPHESPLAPVTPKAKSRNDLSPVSLNAATSTRRDTHGKASMLFDHIENLISLLSERDPSIEEQDSLTFTLGIASRINGILGLMMPKLHLLTVARKLCDLQFGKDSDGAIVISADLAFENVRLGRVHRATKIFAPNIELVKSGRASVDAAMYFYLRYAEALIKSSVDIYAQAMDLSESLDIEDKEQPVNQRIRTRVQRMQLTALASHVFALIQCFKEDVPSALNGLLQSLRLWNRAADSLIRLSSSRNGPPALQNDNPFETSSLEDSRNKVKESAPAKKSFPRRTSMDSLEWQISEGLVATLFSLVEVYLTRGSAREAEYFSQQAYELAESLNAPIVASHALAKRGEIQLFQGHFDNSLQSLTAAAAMLTSTPGAESIDVQRLRGMYNERILRDGDAKVLYKRSLDMIDDLDHTLQRTDNLIVSRKSMSSLAPSEPQNETLLPRLFATLLRLHTIALPMGARSKVTKTTSGTAQDVLLALEAAQNLLWEHISLINRTGKLHDVREAMVSFVLVKAFQTSLGVSSDEIPTLMIGLLDASASITLRREMIETIGHKFPSTTVDDMTWPLITTDGSFQPRFKPHLNKGRRASFSNLLQSDNDDYDGVDSTDNSLRGYWDSVRMRYEAQIVEPSTLSSNHLADLPSNWTVAHIALSEDKSTLFITRQECGQSFRTPLIFCVTLKGRRDNGDGDDEEKHLTFEDVTEEFKEIVRLSDEGTKAAKHVNSDDQEARANWWKQRAALDSRLRDLLENIEFCWLGAFKTILHARRNLNSELIADLRAQFEKVFLRALHVQEAKAKPRMGAHKKKASQPRSHLASQVTFDDALLECFSALSPKCRDEELEDLVYFILDLYHFHGVPVAIAEVDTTQVVVDLRGVMEDHAQKLIRGQVQNMDDEHLFLVLDKNLQGLPWESFPILRGRSVSRIPSVDFLHDRVAFAKWKRDVLNLGNSPDSRGAVVDPRKGYYILNPSGDLEKTETRFKDWALDLEKAGWQGVIGHPPSEQQFLNALRTQDLVIYFGHGGGEQYLRSHKIRNLATCASTMLWGCSSGILREMGDFDRVGTPYNYMLAGSPCLTANLWDVTDRDIDKFTQAVFDKIGLTSDGSARWGDKKSPVSIVEAVAKSRDVCKLKYLTGAAPIVYGIPFYL